METEIIKTASGVLNESVSYMGFNQTLILILIGFNFWFVYNIIKNLQANTKILEKISTRQEDIGDNVKDIKEKLNQIKTI